MKYLFQAVFTDGHTITQTQADKSALIPPDENGNGPSAFYDVLNYPGELESFTLTAANANAVVYMKTGEIVVDGVPQAVQEVPPCIKRELVYWRAMLANYGEAPTITGYMIGWKAGDVQHVVMVN